jgi:hypothetical protein
MEGFELHAGVEHPRMATDRPGFQGQVDQACGRGDADHGAHPSLGFASVYAWRRALDEPS